MAITARNGYARHIWKTNDIVTAERLNNIEEGISDLWGFVGNADFTIGIESGGTGADNLYDARANLGFFVSITQLDDPASDTDPKEKLSGKQTLQAVYDAMAITTQKNKIENDQIVYNEDGEIETEEVAVDAEGWFLNTDFVNGQLPSNTDTALVHIYRSNDGERGYIEYYKRNLTLNDRTCIAYMGIKTENNKPVPSGTWIYGLDFVRRSGDTMSGSLIINNDLTVKGNTILGDANTDTITVTPLTANQAVVTNGNNQLASRAIKNQTSGTVANDTSLITANTLNYVISTLDKTDEAKDGQYVTSVSEKNGIITVTRTGFPNITIAGKTITYNGKITSAELVSSLGLSSALKYKGVVTSLPSATATTTYNTYNSGDVVSYNKKEYVYVKGANASSSTWNELGDESSYLSKTGWTAYGVVYGASGGTLAQVAANTTTTRMFLRMTGNGSTGAIPVWDTLTAADIPNLNANKITGGTISIDRIPVSDIVSQVSSSISGNFVKKTGDTITGQLILSLETDISGTTASGGALVIGNKTGTHLAFDGNEIMAKSDATTPSVLNLNLEGGNVVIGKASDANYNVRIRSTMASTSKTTGALVVAGGAGIGGTVYANAFNGPLTGNVTGTASGNLPLTGGTLTGALTLSAGSVDIQKGNLNIGSGKDANYRGLSIYGASGAPLLHIRNTGVRMTFDEYANGSTGGERYLLPTPETHDKDVWYGVLTTKNTVTVAQGGTGVTTANANYVFAAPNGSNGAPTFRKLVAADIPSLSYLPLTGGTLTDDLYISRSSYPAIGWKDDNGLFAALIGTNDTHRIFMRTYNSSITHRWDLYFPAPTDSATANTPGTIYTTLNKPTPADIGAVATSATLVANKIITGSGNNTVTVATSAKIQTTIAEDLGTETLYIGNSTAQGTSGNARGSIVLYSSSTYYHRLYGATSTTASRGHYLPNANGWLVTAGDGSSTGAGSTTQPVYINSSGVATAGTNLKWTESTNWGTTVNGALAGLGEIRVLVVDGSREMWVNIDATTLEASSAHSFYSAPAWISSIDTAFYFWIAHISATKTSISQSRVLEIAGGGAPDEENRFTPKMTLNKFTTPTLTYYYR